MKLIIYTLCLLLSFHPIVSAQDATPTLDSHPSGIPESVWENRIAGIVTILNGLPIDDIVPVVVINDTNSPLTIYNVIGEARTTNGTLSAISEWSSVGPVVLAPQNVAVGYVAFSTAPKTTDVFTFEVEEDTRELRQNRTIDLDIIEIVPVEGGVIGTLRNPSDRSSTLPADVVGVCIDFAGNIAGYFRGDSVKFTLPPRATSPFEATLYGVRSCNEIMISAYGAY
jgi:hypothetical protein